MGFGSLNKQRKKILNAQRYNLASPADTSNTFFKRKKLNLQYNTNVMINSHKLSLSQILSERKDSKNFKDFKVISKEEITLQRRLPVAVISLLHTISLITCKTPKIKWYELDTEKGQLLIDEISRN